MAPRAVESTAVGQDPDLIELERRTAPAISTELQKEAAESVGPSGSQQTRLMDLLQQSGTGIKKFPKPIRSDQERLESIEHFREGVSLLMGLGYRLEFSPEIGADTLFALNLPGDNDLCKSLAYLTKRLNPEGGEISFDPKKRNPDAELYNDQDQRLLIRPTGDQIPIKLRVLHLELKYEGLKEGFSCRLVNYLDPKHPVVDQVAVGRNTPDKEMADIDGFVDRILRKLPTLNLPRSLSEIPPNTDYHAPIQVLSGSQFSSAVESLKQLNRFTAGESKTSEGPHKADSLELNLAIVPPNQLDDSSTITINGTPRDNIVSFSLSDLEGFGGPMKFSGKLAMIQIGLPQAEPLDLALITARITSDPRRHLLGSESSVVTYYDKFGNTCALGTDDDGTRSLVLMPSLRFERASGQLHEIPIDLSVLDPNFFDVHGLLYQPSQPLIQDRPGLPIFGNFNAAEAIRKYSRDFDALELGINEARRDFNDPKGSLLRHMFLVRSEWNNAYVSPSNRETVVMQNSTLDLLAKRDELARQKGLTGLPDERRLLALHESAHVYDFQYRLALSGGALTELFCDIKQVHPEFFTFLDEQTFVTEGLGGHSSDNPQEFFASLYATLKSEDFDGRLKGASPEFRYLYAHSLGAVFQNLKTTPGLDESPLTSIIYDKIVAINKLIETENPEQACAIDDSGRVSVPKLIGPLNQDDSRPDVLGTESVRKERWYELPQPVLPKL